MLMRVSIGIHLTILNRLETYELMSKRYFTHATPTLFNSGTPKPQMSSCFLLTMKDDSIDGIYDTLKQTAKISSRQEELDFLFTMLEQQVLISQEQMELQMELYPCSCFQRYSSLCRSRWRKTQRIFCYLC